MTSALNKLLVTIGNAAASAASNLLYDFSIPLGIVNLIKSVIGDNQSALNTPQVQQQRGPTQWFSQPAAFQQGNPPRVTVFVCDGTAKLLNTASTSPHPAPDTGVVAQLCSLLDPTVYDVQQVVWPISGFPVWSAIQEGAEALTSAILNGSGQFVLVGYSQGAAVCSQVLNSLQAGDLKPQNPRLLAGTMFGNPCRQQGSVAPGQRDPGGHGILSSYLVADTPSFWWEFANGGDAATSIRDDALGSAIQLMANSVFSGYNGGDLGSWFDNISAALGSQIGNTSLVPELSTFLQIMAGLESDVALLPGLESHAQYETEPPYESAQNLTSVQLAANYLNSVGGTWQSAYQYTNPTEVLQVNFKLPLSIGNLGFRVLRVPCTVTAWYRDRNNNWIQLTDGSDVPVSIRVSYSASGSWFTYDTAIYPVVATALQLRITRNYDPQVGSQPFVVGIKEMLIQRYVYSLNDTVMAIPDQQDALGNVVTSYVKSWGPNNALDSDPGTFWKSFPCPDPNGVVALYLDTRDVVGNPQIIDTLYIDPTYTGNTLNLYYSNDESQGTLIINPVNLPPDSQVNAFWTLGKGLFDTSNAETVPIQNVYSEMVFPVSLGPLNQKPVWVGIEWTPDFNPDPTIAQYLGGPPPYNPVLFGVTPITVNVDAVQSVEVSGSPTGGTFTLQTGFGTTQPIPYDATAAQVQQSLSSLSSVGLNSVSVSGPKGGPWTVTFQGDLAGADIPAMANPDRGKNLTGGLNPSILISSIVAGGSVSVTSGGDTHWPTLYYDTGDQCLTLEFTNGTEASSYHLPLTSPAFTKGRPLQIVVGWDPGVGAVFMSATQSNQLLLNEQAFTTTPPPAVVTLDGEAGYTNFRGLMTALIVKLDSWDSAYQSFQLSPQIYCNPNPVQPNASGVYPSTTLDNAVLACDWTSQSLPIGGTSESWYENKVWTPIYENYVTEKGNLFLPQKILTSYLKMEFSNLTPEPYPVYDQGVQVTYDSFPITVTQQSTTPAEGILGVAQEAASTLLTIGSDLVSTVTSGSLNWFNPQTIQNAINANFGVTQQPVVVQTGPGTVVNTLPNVSQSNVSASYRTEASSPSIYYRTLPSASSLAGQNLAVISSGPPGQTLQPATGAVSTQVAQAFSPVTTTSASNVTAQIGQDWWLFPGLNFKMPASVMNFITGAANDVQGTLGVVQGTAGYIGQQAQAIGNAVGTILYRPPSTTTRVRFTGDVVHRYQQNTLTMTAAVAYFAGMNGVSAYVTDYISGSDPLQFKYDRYDPVTFTYGTRSDGSPTLTQLPSGPVTTAGSPYPVPNPKFLSNLDSWTATGPWSWSPTGGLGYSSGQASALYTCGAVAGSLVSNPVPVEPGDQVIVSAWVSWSDIVLGNGFGGGVSGVGRLSAAIRALGQNQVPFPGLGRLSAAAEALGQHLVPFSGRGLLSAGVRSGQGSRRVDDFPVTLPAAFPGDNFPETFPFFFGEENVYTSLRGSGALRAEIRTGPRHCIALRGQGGLRAETRTLDRYYTTLTGGGSLTAQIGEVVGSEILPEITMTGLTYENLTGTDVFGEATFPFSFVPASGVPIEFSMQGLAVGGLPDTFPFVFPGDYTAADRNSMPSGATVGQNCTILSGNDQGTYKLVNTPASSFSNWSLTRYGTVVNIDRKSSGSFVKLVGSYTVPDSGVDHLALSLNVTNEASTGRVNFDNVQISPAEGIVGMLGTTHTTSTKFSDMGVKVSDSGLMNSDSMWARLDPLDTNIDNLQLAPYVTTYPSILPSGNWNDTFGAWDDPNVQWGEPIGEVSISLDPNLIFQGNRAVHFTRAAGAGNAGIFVTQQVNMMAEELCQLGCVFYKPNGNNNQITLTLRRVSDGVTVHTETFTPLVGYWYTYQTQFFELPSTLDQVYTLEFLTSGDAADEIYLSNLYCNVAGIRYFLQLGDSSAFDFDVTPLVYADNASVSCSTPVDRFSLNVQVYNPDSWAYGMTLTPRYLR